MTYQEALSFLGQTRFFGMKLGLERMQALASALGNPQQNLRFIHLAGTNGKGSTAAFCESGLRASGCRVGLYTSPHLIGIRERLQIDRAPISEADFAEGISAVREAVRALEDREATFFEILTALALWYFAREKVDWVVWETGLGGRLDATNIVNPEVCIITNIGLEHQQYLGETLREIAEEKAGILKQGVPAITAVANPEGRDVIETRARKLDCPLTLLPRHDYGIDLGLRDSRQIARIDGHEFELGLLGTHQVENAACAHAALRILGISNEALTTGFAQTKWPGRFEILSESPFIVLDGAHNPSGMKELAATWQNFLAVKYGWTLSETESRTHLVFASVTDKAIAPMADILRPLARQVSLVRLGNERTAEPSQLARHFSGLPCTLFDSVAQVSQALDLTAKEVPVLITGSLFLVGEMLAQRDGVAGEYQLNEQLEKAKPAQGNSHVI